MAEIVSMMPEGLTATQLLEEIAQEKRYLDQRGYCFPALFAAVELLLKREAVNDPQ